MKLMNRRINGLVLWLLTMLVLVTSTTSAAQTAEQKRWEKTARGVTITRDIWGIAHVSGKTDADAVFVGRGLLRDPYFPLRRRDAARAEWPDQYEYEVLIFDQERERRLVAAVELISPANKDRPESRRALVTKCATLLRQGVGIALVAGNMYYTYLARRLAAKENRTDVTAMPYVDSLYNTAYRMTRNSEDAEDLVQECGAGLVTLQVSGDLVSFQAPPLIRDGPLSESRIATLAHVLGIGRVDLARPVVREAQRLQLRAKTFDVALGRDLRMRAGLYRILLGGQAERVPADRVQHVEAAHRRVPRDPRGRSRAPRRQRGLGRIARMRVNPDPREPVRLQPAVDHLIDVIRSEAQARADESSSESDQAAATVFVLDLEEFQRL